MQLEVWRCPKCGRVLARLSLQEGVVEVRCHRCKALATLTVRPTLQSLASATK